VKLRFMDIDPRRMIVLRAVERHGGVVAAASALHISPSAVSQQLVLLERETGFALVDRSRRGGHRSIQFTTAGRRLLVHAEALVQVLDDAAAELNALAGAVTGPVTVAAFVTALRGFAGPAIVSLAETHPGIHLSVHQLNDLTAAADVLAGRTDLALIEDDAQRRRPVPRGLRYEALYDDPFRVVVPADWPEFDDLAVVAGRPWIDGPADSAVGQAMRRVRQTSALELPAEHICQDFSAALVLVSAGLAGAFVPVLALTASPPAGIREVALAGLGSRRIGVLYRRSRNEPTPAVRTVLDAFRSAALESTRG
jgi:DNA-binding transcriptional LysR family regulator